MSPISASVLRLILRCRCQYLIIDLNLTIKLLHQFKSLHCFCEMNLGSAICLCIRRFLPNIEYLVTATTSIEAAQPV